MDRSRRHHRPALPGAEMFEAVVGGIDPALMSEAAERCATALVRGTGPGDDDVVRRLITLADSEGLDSLAQVWSHAPADSIAGALWRLYLLRTFVYNSPNQASAEYAAGRPNSGAAHVVAGVVDPPGPEEVKALVDTVLSGVAQADFADALFRGAAFAHVVALGRARLNAADAQQSARLATLADQLHHAGRLELAGHLGDIS